jgi:hypothetical protein
LPPADRSAKIDWMACWGRLVPLLVVVLAPAAGGCSLLIDSDVGVRGGDPGEDASNGGDGGADAVDCPILPGFPPFADDFESDDLAWAIDPKIQRDGAGAIEAGVSGGALRFAPGVDATDSAWVKSVEFDFLTGRIALRIPPITVRDGTEAYVALISPGVRHMMRFDGTHLTVPGGTSVPYDGDALVWWQIRSQDYFLRFETSMDGVIWSELDRIPLDIDPTQARIEIGISVSTSSAASPGELVVDDLNLPPCR